MYFYISIWGQLYRSFSFSKDSTNQHLFLNFDGMVPQRLVENLLADRHLVDTVYEKRLVDKKFKKTSRPKVYWAIACCQNVRELNIC